MLTYKTENMLISRVTGQETSPIYRKKTSPIDKKTSQEPSHIYSTENKNRKQVIYTERNQERCQIKGQETRKKEVV